MDVTLLGNYPNDENESMVRYAEMLRRLLTGRGIRVEILRPESCFGRFKRSIHGFGKWLGYIDKYILFPFVLRRHIRARKGNGEFVVHICDHSNAVYTRWLQDVPHLVTCHDVMAIMAARGHIPGLKTGWTGRLLQNWIFSGLKHASYIICITEETRNDLLMLAPELEQRSCAIELPLNYPFAPMPEQEAITQITPLTAGTALHLETDRFLFHVGGNQWYKNREGVIRIYSHLLAAHPELSSLKLVMAGKPPTEKMKELVLDENLADKVIFLTSVSDQQLCAFYSLAQVLIYPSLKEGFGWPIIEAQACACPVVTSNLAPMNRLAGPASLLADPEKKPAFAEQIFQLLTDSFEAREFRKSEALLHSRNFEPRAYLEQILSKYVQLVRKNNLSSVNK